MSNQIKLSSIQYAPKYHKIEGVTRLVENHFLQAEGLAKIAEESQKLGLSVMVFSGYLFEELQDQKFKGASHLLAATDLLVDGEYEIENTRKYKELGRFNQSRRFHYLTNFIVKKLKLHKF